TLTVSESEMGQGVWTSLPMIIAEEMELDWTKVTVVQAPVDENYFGRFDMGTGGSSSIRTSWEKMRKAGAVAKDMLLDAAIGKWSVSKADCFAENGFIIHRSTGKKISYGDLAHKASMLDVPKSVQLKNPDTFRIIGTDILRTDAPLKVNGTAQYAMDVNLPDMMYASVERCPYFGGKLKTVDDRDSKKVKGVLDIIEIENGFAVVGTSTWAALQGRKKLKITWDKGSNKYPDSKSISEFFKKRSRKRGAKGRNEGNVKKVLKDADRVIEAAYEVPFQAHATMEPMNCVVDYQSDQCQVWAPTQSPKDAKKRVREMTGLSDEKVIIHVPFLGGGFGRRAFNDFIEEGVEVSMKLKKPVKLIWTREDDMQHDYYRPASRHVLKAGLMDNGETIAWFHSVVAPSIFFGQMFKYPVPFKDKLDVVALAGAKEVAYGIPNIRVEYTSANTDIPVGWWRSVYDSQNAYANECFIDELANSLKIDPVDYRLRLLKQSPRHTAVLKQAAQESDWGKPLKNNHYQGVSCHASFGTYVAQIAEVSVNNEGSVHVHRVVCAVDCGQAVSPITIKAQMEGSIVYGLSATLNGEITIENGAVKQSNFHDFQVLRMDQMPTIDVHIIKSSEPPSGIGEPGLPPIAPAVANAVFSATGKRIRKLPIKAEDFLA
nr:xanthine dehydrogenase family protein molybdopterin-binding subunit [Candidatus Neomarinimicrobiota bacterium]